MRLRYLIVAASIALILGLFYVVTSHKPDPVRSPFRDPAQKPYKNTIAGVGIVEAYNENINVAPFAQGKIEKVYVKEGQKVKAGDPLYKLDTQVLSANVKVFYTEAEAKMAYIEKLKNMPRKEDIPPLEAQIQQAQAKYNNISAQLRKLESVSDKRSISKDALDSKRFDTMQSKAELEKAKSELAKLKAGAWKYDIAQAEQEYNALIANANQINVSIAQSIVRSPLNGEILKVNAHVGEFVSPNDITPPVLLGTTRTMQIRVDIDEINASNVRPDMKATAFLKGDASKKFPLEFVRIQPYMVPKKDLSGASTERVDVRVLQLIYKFDPPPFPVYVGQQVDVFLDRK